MLLNVDKARSREQCKSLPTNSPYPPSLKLFSLHIDMAQPTVINVNMCHFDSNKPKDNNNETEPEVDEYLAKGCDQVDVERALDAHYDGERQCLLH